MTSSTTVMEESKEREAVLLKEPLEKRIMSSVEVLAGIFKMNPADPGPRVWTADSPLKTVVTERASPPVTVTFL